jgi:bacterioferritin
MANHPFVTDIQTLRARARQHVEQGAVTQGYRAGLLLDSRVVNVPRSSNLIVVTLSSFNTSDIFLSEWG